MVHHIRYLLSGSGFIGYGSERYSFELLAVARYSKKGQLTSSRSSIFKIFDYFLMMRRIGIFLTA
jgi:hypothetical protein